MSSVSTTCHRAVGTELCLVDVGSMEDLLDQISSLQHQLSSLQQELNRLTEEREPTRTEREPTRTERESTRTVRESTRTVRESTRTERELTRNGLDAQKQKSLHDCVGALSVCSGGEAASSFARTPGGGCDGDELREDVSEGEEGAEPLQDGDVPTSLKACSVKLMDCRMAPILNAHTTQEETDDTGNDEFDTSFLEKWWKRSTLGKKSSMCSECGKKFSRPSTLRAHMRTHTGDTLPRCACGQKFSYTSSLVRHQKERCSLFSNSREDRKIPPAEQRQFQCSFCGKQFSTKGQVTIHERLHTGKKPFECSECQQAFVRVDRLKEHQRVHTGEKPYECSYCGKQFALLGGLKTHRRTHTGEKPYKCTVCKKRFTQSTKLKIHLRIHTGERPYRCSECGKAFARTEHLRTHQKVHGSGKQHCRAPPEGRLVSAACSANQQPAE